MTTGAEKREGEAMPKPLGFHPRQNVTELEM